MNTTASPQRLFRGIALAALLSLAPIAGCGKGSNPPAATETAKTAPPAVDAPAAATPAAAPTSSYTSTTTQPAAKPDPKQVFTAHDRDLYQRAAKLQNDEKFADAGAVVQGRSCSSTPISAVPSITARALPETGCARMNGWRNCRWTIARSCARAGSWATRRWKIAQGRPAAAIDHTKQSAQILAALGGNQTIAYGKLCELNGVSAADLGDAAAADRALRAAIDVYGKTIGNPSLEESSALAAMSEMYATRGDMKSSLQCIMQAVNAEASCRVAGEPDAMASYLLCKLGRRFRDLGEYALAENIFKQSANVARLANGLRSNEYIGCTQDLAAAYLYEGKLQEAESLELEVLELIGQGAATGSNTMQILARGLLGSAYVQMGKYDMADPILRRTLDLARNSLDEKSPYVGLLMGGVAELDIARKQYQAAEPLLTRAWRSPSRRTAATNRGSRGC